MEIERIFPEFISIRFGNENPTIEIRALSFTICVLSLDN
jgi:hypothetical protein